ncbi:unnamed protein product [Meganyctiphanes norvegica]|uniref:Uncharacterized protein n=1 Tax=Meganyctiphanes norvegica TaxID=48144 RepID=A0AAV2QXV8_MEGNR
MLGKISYHIVTLLMFHDKKVNITNIYQAFFYNISLHHLRAEIDNQLTNVPLYYCTLHCDFLNPMADLSIAKTKKKIDKPALRLPILSVLFLDYANQRLQRTIANRKMH